MVTYDYSEETIDQFKQRLPLIRFIFGCTQAELARLLGVSRMTVNQIEAHNKPMSLLHYLACLHIFTNWEYEDTDPEIRWYRIRLRDYILDCSEAEVDTFRGNVNSFKRIFGVKNGTTKQSELFIEIIVDDPVDSAFNKKYDFTDEIGRTK